MKKLFKSDFKKPAALILLAAVFVLGSFNPVKAGQTEKVLIFAAASTTNVVEEIIELYAEKNYGRVVPSFASSSTLAKQINAGAPADIYISANPKWMKFLDDNGRIDKQTRHNLLGNRIVLITPAENKLEIDIHPGFDLAGILAQEKMAMGDPDHVPAGIYGKQALESLGVWKKVASKIVRAKDVRTALVFVERGEVPLGIVYATDAAITQKVRVAGIFPENSHPPITYQAAIVKGSTLKAARQFFKFFESPQAHAIFEKYGFSVK